MDLVLFESEGMSPQSWEKTDKNTVSMRRLDDAHPLCTREEGLPCRVPGLAQCNEDMRPLTKDADGSEQMPARSPNVPGSLKYGELELTPQCHHLRRNGHG